MRFGDVESQGSVTPIPDPTDFNISGQVQGDVLYFNGANWVRLAPGTADQSLRTKGAAANPVWENVNNATNLSISGETTGDMLYYNGANWVRLAGGTSGDVLTANGAGVAPTYQTPAGGDGSGVASFQATNGSGSVPNVGSKTMANFSESFDTGADFNPTTGIFTCPNTGVYTASASLRFTQSSSASTITMTIGGTQVANFTSVTGAVYSFGGTVLLNETASNTITVVVSTDNFGGPCGSVSFNCALLA